MGGQPTKEAKVLMGYIADHHDNLRSSLSDEQKEIPEKFDDCYAELTDITERELICTGILSWRENRDGGYELSSGIGEREI